MFRIILLLLLLLPISTQAEEGVTKVITDQVIFPTWQDKTLKYSFIGAFIGMQTVSGLVEGYRYSGREIVTDNTYHAFQTGRDVLAIGTGWLSYATIQSKTISTKKKIRRILGTALIARDFKEWSYKAQRYGNPFDYSKERNQHAIVYFTSQGDAYIGTGPFTGPLVDLLCLTGGILLIGGNDIYQVSGE